MPREHNFLLGHGEKLTRPIEIRTGGGTKNAPYTLSQAKERLLPQALEIEREVASLPLEACPGDEAVAVMTLHPRYVSKSDAPTRLIQTLGLRTVGTRPQRVRWEKWGTQRPPARAEILTDDLFVAGPRDALTRLAHQVRAVAMGSPEAGDLTHLEGLSPFRADSKVRSVPANERRPLLEIALHCERRPEQMLRDFSSYVRGLEAEVLEGRERIVPGLLFVPVRADASTIPEIAKFSFLRVLRGMPTLRPIDPGPLRAAGYGPATLPEGPALAPHVRVAVFDGGLPAQPDLSAWVRSVEAPDLGAPVSEYVEHGLAVTSACLFGSISGPGLPKPHFRIDHHRVLDADKDLEYLNALDRVVEALDRSDEPYEFASLSLGPAVPVVDDEVSAWTARIDEVLSRRSVLLGVAAGNHDSADPNSGLNRIQCPADGVNVLTVGAADSTGPSWGLARYSAVGPGRSPGIVKPDGVAFGGDDAEPFVVLRTGTPARTRREHGTSFATPSVVRAAAAIRSMFGPTLTPLALGALLVHRCEDGGLNRAEVGWGRFETDPVRLATCEDNEVLVAYQGQLNPGEWLRADVPLPSGRLIGKVTLTATVMIRPRVEPGAVSTYTRDGVEVRFRPHAGRFGRPYRGRRPTHARAVSLFSDSNLLGAGEHAIREEGCKWEPCLRASRTFNAASLSNPSFDLYYHTRTPVAGAEEARPMAYAMMVTVRASRVNDLYNQIVRAHAGVLVPLRPNVLIQVQT